MKRILNYFRRLYNRIHSFFRRLFHRKTLFEKLLETYKETNMDITTITQLIDAFRAETAQDAITPDSLGQLLQKIVNLLGDAADTSTVQQLTTWMNNLSGAQSLIRNIRATSSDDGITFYLDMVDATTGDRSTQSLSITYPKLKLVNGAANGFYLLTLTNEAGDRQYSQIKIYGATTQYAGIMTAADKTKLENVASGLNSLADEVALKATKHELEQVTTWQDKVKGIGDAVKSVSVSPDMEKMFMRIQKGNLANGQNGVDNVLIPHVTERTAGVMSAEDYANLQALIEQSEQGGGTTPTVQRTFFPIDVEPKGNKLIISYPIYLTDLGYVPYLYRYSVRRTHFGSIQSGGPDRLHGPRKKGWHRNHDQKRIRLDEHEILIGRRIDFDNSGEPEWDYLANGPRELFGRIHDLTDGNGRWIGYRFMFGLKQFCFSPESTRHRFTFGIAFGPEINENRKSINPCQLVTNIAQFHVEVKFDPNDQHGPQEAPELNFRYCI